MANIRVPTITERFSVGALLASSQELSHFDESVSGTLIVVNKPEGEREYRKQKSANYPCQVSRWPPLRDQHQVSAIPDEASQHSRQ